MQKFSWRHLKLTGVRRDGLSDSRNRRGATKTVVTVRRNDGTVLFDGRGEGSNYKTSGAGKVKEVLAALLTEVQRIHPELQVDIAIFALAGIDSKQDKVVVQAIVEKVCQLVDLKLES